MNNVAVVLLNYNGLGLLKKFLPNAIRFSPNALITVIDNGSDDDSVNWIKQNHPEVKCIELHKNFGYAGGYNEGLKQVKSNFYALVNTDIELTEGWLDPLLNRLDTNPKTAVVQPHILDYNNKTHFEYAGAAGGYLDSFGIPFCRGRILKHIEEDLGQYNETERIFWASGACFLIRNELFWKLGGFDASFFAHQEEIDLCWRLFNEGYEIESVGSSKVFHIGAATLPPSARKIFLNHRNSLLMCAKNLPKEVLYSTLFKKLCLDGLIGISYFFNLNFKATWAIIQAHFSFYKRFNYSILTKVKTIKNPKYFRRKSILVDYFIFRRLKFSDLNKKYK